MRFYRMKRNFAFTLIEVLIVIAIIAIMAAILFPFFASAKHKSKNVACLSNVKQISLGILMYSQDYDEKMPYAKRYQELVCSYVKKEQVYHCPLVTGFPENQGYALESRLIGRNPYEIKEDIAKRPLLWDSLNLAKNATDPGIGFAARHYGFGSIAFVDGHARSYREAEGRALMFAPIVFEEPKP
jgi:prepilin-type N-terminal cleavage/methylation domain-containing protein/prepilin-type processing-associated H-X9-DG protein